MIGGFLHMVTIHTGTLTSGFCQVDDPRFVIVRYEDCGIVNGWRVIRPVYQEKLPKPIGKPV